MKHFGARTCSCNDTFWTRELVFKWIAESFCAKKIASPLDSAILTLRMSAPSPSQSTWSSESVIKVKGIYCVNLESMISKGERYPYGGLQVKAELRSKSHDFAVVPGEVEDHGDGTYTNTLTPQTPGPHQLFITMDGQRIQNSPCDLDLRRHRQYNTLCNPEQAIKCCSGGPCGIAIHDSGDIYVTCS